MSSRPPDTGLHQGTWRRRARPVRWLAPQTGRSRLRIAAAAAASLLLLLVTAALAVPPLLDWSRYRTTIGSIAASQLGRPVIIGGEVTLRLLPEAILTATNVTLPDQGDGVSAQLGALRLQLALAPLLAGRIVPRDLVLSSPVLRLPWPLPGSITHPARPHVPHAFAAHMENGTLRIGQAEVSGINAHIHGGPVLPASLAASPEDTTALAFGAEGFAAFGGRSWRFTTALGAADVDGVSAVDLGVVGQGDAGRTGGAIQGSLAGGIVQGRLTAGGPDLSLLLQSAPLEWRLEAPFVASGEQIKASAISLTLGGAPADGALVMRLAAPATLSGSIHAAALNLDAWAHAIATRPERSFILPHLPGRLTVAIDSAQLFGGTLHALRGTLGSDGSTLSIEHAEAQLPGNATASLDGSVADGPAGPVATGPARLDAPDLHATLAWLRPIAPGLLDALPRTALLQAHLGGQVTLSAGSLAVAGMAGQVDGAGISGGFSAALGQAGYLHAALSFDTIDLDAWAGSATPIGSSLDLRAARAVWHGLPLRDLTYGAQPGSGGATLRHAEASLAGASLTASGSVAADGAVQDGRVSAIAADLAPLLAALPLSWRWAPGLWHGPGSLQVTASGPQAALDVELRADAADLIVEANGQADLPAGGGTGTLTLRHPGAPRLLAALGVPDAETWLDTGSLALRAQIAASPGHLVVQDFDLAAAALRLGGNLAVDLTQPELRLTGRIDADTLALPVPTADSALPLSWLRGWSASLGLNAAKMSVGGVDWASGVVAQADIIGGDGLISLTRASVAGGSLAGQFAYDASPALMTVAADARVAGAALNAAAAPAQLALTAGWLTASLELLAKGNTEAALEQSLAGSASATLQNAQLSGFDLQAAGHAATLPGPAGTTAMKAALTQGVTRTLSGTIMVGAANGKVAVVSGVLDAPGGAVSLSGSAELAPKSLDLTFRLTPDHYTGGLLGVHLNGPWQAARVNAFFLPRAPAPRQPVPHRMKHRTPR